MSANHVRSLFTNSMNRGRATYASKAWLEEVKKGVVELPLARKRRFMEQYKLPDGDADVFVNDVSLGDYFEQIAVKVEQPKALANWVINNLPQLAFLHISYVIPSLQRESDIGNSTVATWRLKQTHASITTGIFTRVRDGDHACPDATFSAFERKCDSQLHRCYRGAETNTCKYHNWHFRKRWDRQLCVPRVHVPMHKCTHVAI